MKHARFALPLLFSLTLLATPRVAAACTTFLLESGADRVVGKSYDWHMGQGLVVINKRGVAKQALAMKPGDTPARWVSQYASVTFNQYGRELPNGGMNEAGLVVEIMWLDGSVEPPPDARPTVSELQWIEYMLDRFGSVGELVAAADQLRVSRVHGKVHYLACDRAGACAAFEYLDGKLVISTGAALPAKVLTNHPYATSLAYLKQRARKLPSGGGSLERFARTAQLLAHPPAPSELVTRAFQLLDGVRGPESQWNLVYDPVHLRVHFRSRAQPRVKTVELGRFDGSCGAPVQVLDLDADLEGDVTSRFAPYSEAVNRRLVERSAGELARKLPPGTIESVAHYPSALACTRP